INALALNQLPDYITGGGDRLAEPIDPTHVFLRPGFRLVLSGSEFNRQWNPQIPGGERFVWDVPQTGQDWTNTDIAALTHLLALARLRFSPPSSGALPFPADFVAALVTQSGESRFGSVASRQASDLVRRIYISFRTVDFDPGNTFGGGFHAARLARS